MTVDAGHPCIQDKRIDGLERRLKEGHDDFRDIRTSLEKIHSRLGFINGRVTAWGGIAGAVAGVVGSIIVVLVLRALGIG